MSGYSSYVVLYDPNENVLPVQNATAIPVGTPALMTAGSDGTNSRYISIDSSGRQIFIGSGTDNTTNSTAKLPVLAARANTSAPSFTDGYMAPLSVDISGALRATIAAMGTVGATVPSTPIVIAGKDSFNDVTILKTQTDGTLLVGQGTASNLRSQTASESATGSAPPSLASLMGGSVTTSAPSYTNGQMSPLSLDTTGALRITGTISATNPSVSLASLPVPSYATFVGGYTYSSGINWGTNDGYLAPLLVNRFGGGLRIEGTWAAGTALSTTGSVLVGGAVNTASPALTPGTIDNLSLTTSGGLRVEPQSTTKVAYSGATRNITPPATPTDIATITGSATKTVRVLKIILSATQTTAGINEFLLVKRSTANTGGTSTTPTACPLDSNSGAATAVIRQYSANPTSLGATVANVQAVKLLTPQATSATQSQYVMDFSDGGLFPGIVLRGVAQTLALNFNGVALPTGLNIACTFEWIEE